MSESDDDVTPDFGNDSDNTIHALHFDRDEYPTHQLKVFYDNSHQYYYPSNQQKNKYAITNYYINTRKVSPNDIVVRTNTSYDPQKFGGLSYQDTEINKPRIPPSDLMSQYIGGAWMKEKRPKKKKYVFVPSPSDTPREYLSEPELEKKREQQAKLAERLKRQETQKRKLQKMKAKQIQQAGSHVGHRSWAQFFRDREEEERVKKEEQKKLYYQNLEKMSEIEMERREKEHQQEIAEAKRRKKLETINHDDNNNYYQIEDTDINFINNNNNIINIIDDEYVSGDENSSDSESDGRVDTDDGISFATMVKSKGKPFLIRDNVQSRTHEKKYRFSSKAKQQQQKEGQNEEQKEEQNEGDKNNKKEGEYQERVEEEGQKKGEENDGVKENEVSNSDTSFDLSSFVPAIPVEKDKTHKKDKQKKLKHNNNDNNTLSVNDFLNPGTQQVQSLAYYYGEESTNNTNNGKNRSFGFVLQNAEKPLNWVSASDCVNNYFIDGNNNNNNNNNASIFFEDVTQFPQPSFAYVC